MPAIINYVLHLLSALLLLTIFFIVYTRITPYHEVDLIKQGNPAAALSLSGALIGFSLTIASGILHSSSLLDFIGWSFGALVVQMAAYYLASKLADGVKPHIEAGNTAVGGFVGALSLTAGIVNAACLS